METRKTANEQQPYKFGQKRWFFYQSALAFGINYYDLVRLEPLIADVPAWSLAIAQLAARYAQAAQEAWESQRVQSALQWWRHAADYYHYAQISADGEKKREYQTLRRQAYSLLISRLTPPSQRLAIPFQETTLPGYLRVVRPGAPCVILLHGLSSSKEVELHKLGEIFVQRGMSVMCFDGPGESELEETWPMLRNYEIAVSAVIDFLSSQEGVDPARLGVFGFSIGGYHAVRAAAMDRRIRACISLSGFFDWTIMRNLTPINQAVIARKFRMPDLESLIAPTSQMTLANLPQAVTQPFLIVHGSSDHMVSMDHVERMRALGQGETCVRIIDGAGHLCYSHFNEVLPEIGDWMAEQLQKC